MNLFNEVQEVLPKFKGYYHPTQTNEEGLSLFVKNTIKTNEVGDAFVFRWRDAMEHGDTKTLGRNLQYISLEQKGKKYFVANFYGLWNGVGKFDTEDRLGQSHKIKDFLDARNEDYKIIVGDFNLLSNTKSLGILEDGMRNLIKEYSVTSTRTSFYKKSERLADYALLSPNLIVKNFEVLADEVSDHSALLLEI
jgi:hypothetical protein